MKKDNALITQESTEMILRKATNIMNRTNKILKNSKRELVANPEIVVIDGLMYQNQTFTEGKYYTWNEAKEYAKNCNLGAYDDWRLPTREELKKIMNIKIPLFYFDNNERKLDDNNFDKRKKWYYQNKGKQLISSNENSYFIKKEFLENMPKEPTGYYEAPFWTGEEVNASDAWGVDFRFGMSLKYRQSYGILVRLVRNIL